jgi:hypothetical protein
MPSERCGVKNSLVETIASDACHWFAAAKSDVGPQHRVDGESLVPRKVVVDPGRAKGDLPVGRDDAPLEVDPRDRGDVDRRTALAKRLHGALGGEDDRPFGPHLEAAPLAESGIDVLDDHALLGDDRVRGRLGDGASGGEAHHAAGPEDRHVLEIRPRQQHRLGKFRERLGGRRGRRSGLEAIARWRRHVETRAQFQRRRRRREQAPQVGGEAGLRRDQCRGSRRGPTLERGDLEDDGAPAAAGDQQVAAARGQARPLGRFANLVEVDGELVDEPLGGRQAVDPHHRLVGAEPVASELHEHVALKHQALGVVDRPHPRPRGPQLEVLRERAHRQDEAAQRAAGDGHPHRPGRGRRRILSRSGRRDLDRSDRGRQERGEAGDRAARAGPHRRRIAVTDRRGQRR